MRKCTVERLEDRTVLAAGPFGVAADDTGEFLLGDVLVTVVLMESSDNTSLLNNNSETWTSDSIDSVKTKVEDGMNWWEQTLANITTKHELKFHYDYAYADSPVLTDYEPITRPSTDFQFWMVDFLQVVDFNNTGDFSSDIRSFNDSQRQAHNTDWAFTIFVVNDEIDADGFFAPGGFQKAFAFAGGRFFVVPAGRPASTMAHETGHMFWARDEYAGGGNYDTFRGYYNTQNVNAWDNPTEGFVQQPSIMGTGNCEDGGGHLCTAWLNHTSSPTSLEMIGWRDTDSDGVFDLADVPHSLQGSGYYDPVSSEYHFVGQSAVATLPNLNPSGRQNDITPNAISRAQYRIDSGPWQTAEVYDSHLAAISLAIAMPEGSNQIEIRTVDDVTGVSSSIFHGSVAQPSSTLHPGINGFVWADSNRNGHWDDGEPAVAGQSLRLVDATGDTLVLDHSIEPDDFTVSSTLLNNILTEVELTAIGAQVSNGSVSSIVGVPAEAGNRVFANFTGNCGGYCRDWNSSRQQLRMDFSSPMTQVSIDVIGSSDPGYGRLEVYDADDNLLARSTSNQLAEGQAQTLTLSRSTAEIAYAIAGGHASNSVQLDRLRFGTASDAITDAHGSYAFSYLPSGAYTVEVVAQPGQGVVSPLTGQRTVTLLGGVAENGVDFGLATVVSPWQNPNDPLDVTADTVVAPIDALKIINDLNRNGARRLTDEQVPPFLDVNGDLHVAPIDALLIINELNLRARGEGELPGVVNWIADSQMQAAADTAVEHTLGSGGAGGNGSSLTDLQRGLAATGRRPAADDGEPLPGSMAFDHRGHLVSTSGRANERPFAAIVLSELDLSSRVLSDELLFDLAQDITAAW